MKNFIKKNIKLVLVFILELIISGVGAYALTVGADQITYDNTQSGIEANNVKDAIDKLYEKAQSDNSCGIAINYNANGGAFNNKLSNTVNYYPYTYYEEKISKTGNVNNKGNRYSTSYESYMPYATNGINDVITISGAKNLTITIKYQTYDSINSWVAVYDGSVTPTKDNTASSISGKLYGQTTTTKTYTVSGDTVQFFFRNVNKQDHYGSNYLGYYATVRTPLTNVITIGGEYKNPTKTNSVFKEWNTKSDGSGVSYATEQDIKDDINNLNTNKILYAIWK